MMKLKKINIIFISMIFLWLFIKAIWYLYWTVLIGTVDLPISKDYLVLFPNESNLQGYIYDAPADIRFPDYYQIQNKNVKYILVLDTKTHKRQGYFFNLTEKYIYMTSLRGIRKICNDNKTAIVDKLAIELSFQRLLQLETNCNENNNTISFYVNSAPEDNGYNGKPIAPNLFLYHKTMNIVKINKEMGG